METYSSINQAICMGLKKTLINPISTIYFMLYKLIYFDMIAILK